MKSLRNSVTLIGHLGGDPEVKNYAGDKKKASFSIATTDTYKNNKGDKVSDTQWHNIVIWGKTAEALHEFLVKGRQVYIEGKLTSREWEKDGVKRRTTEVKADRVLLLGSAANRPTAGAGDTPGTVAAPDEDSIPF